MAMLNARRKLFLAVFDSEQTTDPVLPTSETALGGYTNVSGESGVVTWDYSLENGTEIREGFYTGFRKRDLTEVDDFTIAGEFQRGKTAGNLLSPLGVKVIYFVDLGDGFGSGKERIRGHVVVQGRTLSTAAVNRLTLALEGMSMVIENQA